MLSRLNTLHEIELIERVRWLIRLRWCAVTGVLATTAIAGRGFNLPLPMGTLLGISGVIALYNTIFWQIDRRTLRGSAEGRGARASIMANLQISLDLIALTLLIHFSGGLENPFYFYYIFHMIIAGILLSARASYMQAALATALFMGMTLLEDMGLIHHIHLGSQFIPGDFRGQYALHLAASTLVFASTLFLSVYMATSIVGRLRAREEEVLILTGQLEEKAAQLQKAYDRLDEIERAKSSYMRKVSHELRSPLAAIQSALKVVLEGLTGGVSGKTREMIERAERRSLGLLGLINDLLVLSRAREMKRPAQLQPVGISEALSKVIELQRPLAERKQIRLKTELADRMAPILGNPEEMDELFTNLIGNAIKYTPEGGEVQILGAESGSQVRILVSDTGIGIGPDDLEKVFGEFFRSEEARKFAEEGTGLGLSIAKSIVDSHGGRISVASERGQGTQFEVMLPRQSSNQSPEA